MQSQTIKNTDSEGRITLSKTFANKAVVIDNGDDTFARIVPSRESWLYENPKAHKLIAAGLEQARRGEIASNPPDLDTDGDFVYQL